jgi:hypothetical protein
LVDDDDDDDKNYSRQGMANTATVGKEKATCTLGASGAICAVMMYYFLLFPKASFDVVGNAEPVTALVAAIAWFLANFALLGDHTGCGSWCASRRLYFWCDRLFACRLSSYLKSGTWCGHPTAGGDDTTVEEDGSDEISHNQRSRELRVPWGLLCAAASK